MLCLRALLNTVGIFLLMALAAWGCSGSGDETASDQPAAAQLIPASDLKISSPNFTDIRPRTRIPAKHTCYGEDISPPLNWSGVPEGAKSLALIAENPDDASQIFAHWVLYNIPAEVTELAEGVPTTTEMLPDGSVQGINDFKRSGYGGPCPPPNYGQTNTDSGPGGRAAAQIKKPHRYIFRLYALDTELDLDPGATKAVLIDAMDGHLMAQAEMAGSFFPSVQFFLYTEASGKLVSSPTPAR